MTHIKLKSHLKDTRTTKLKGAEKKRENRKYSIYLLLYQEYHEEFRVFQLILSILLQLNLMVIQYKYELILNVLLDDMFEQLVLDDLILIQHQELSIVHEHQINLYLIMNLFLLVDHDDLNVYDIIQEVYPKIVHVPIIQFEDQLSDRVHHYRIKIRFSINNHKKRL